MLIRVQKWGNSLVACIPKLLAAEVGLEQNTQVGVSLVDGKLVVAPVIGSELTLELLLPRVTEQNLRGDVDTGPRMENEVW